MSTKERLMMVAMAILAVVFAWKALAPYLSRKKSGQSNTKPPPRRRPTPEIGLLPRFRAQGAIHRILEIGRGGPIHIVILYASEDQPHACTSMLVGVYPTERDIPRELKIELLRIWYLRDFVAEGEDDERAIAPFHKQMRGKIQKIGEASDETGVAMPGLPKWYCDYLNFLVRHYGRERAEEIALQKLIGAPLRKLVRGHFAGETQAISRPVGTGESYDIDDS